MRPTKTQQGDSDEVLEAMKAASNAVGAFEKQFKLFVDHSPMYPTPLTPAVRKLHRLSAEYLKLLKSIMNEVGLE